MMELKPGTPLLGGRYIIKCKLAQGGFGITYLAEQVALKREVAVKEFFMKESCVRDDVTGKVTVPSTGSAVQVGRYHTKFLKEAQILSSLNHPNIIQIIDVFEEMGTAYYVMPYMPNGSLRDVVNKRGRLSEKEALKYIGQIAQALNYIHKQKHLCHFDVKPGNILLDSYNNAVLIDFGISKNYDSDGNETSSTPVGKSAGFAPLEQYQEMVNEFSPASDVYALGATLYYLVMGKVPPTAISLSQGEKLTFDNRVSQGTRHLIEEAMKLSSRQRPQSVDTFLTDSSSSSEQTRLESEKTQFKPSAKEVKTVHKPKKESPIEKPNKKKSISPGIIAAIIIAALAGVLLVLQPWNTSTAVPAVMEDYSDSLRVSPVYTAKYAFECLKNGDEEGFKSCLIEYDAELSNKMLDSTVYNEVMSSIDYAYSQYVGDLLTGSSTLEIDYAAYHDYLDRSDQIIQDNREDYESNGYNFQLVVFEAHFIRMDGKELTANLYFTKNSRDEWKMSSPFLMTEEAAPVEEEKEYEDSCAAVPDSAVQLAAD